MTQYIPWLIALGSLIFAILSYAHTISKDGRSEEKASDFKLEGIKESILKANMKLDQVCATTNETRSDIKSLNKDLTEIDRRVSIMERDLKTAFNQIDDLKKGMMNHD